MRRQPPALISNEYRTCSMSIPEVEREAQAKRGGFENPLDILIRLERRYGTVTEDDLTTAELYGHAATEEDDSLQLYEEVIDAEFDSHELYDTVDDFSFELPDPSAYF